MVVFYLLDTHTVILERLILRGKLVNQQTIGMIEVCI